MRDVSNGALLGGSRRLAVNWIVMNATIVQGKKQEFVFGDEESCSAALLIAASLSAQFVWAFAKAASGFFAGHRSDVGNAFLTRSSSQFVVGGDKRILDRLLPDLTQYLRPLTEGYLNLQPGCFTLLEP